MKAPFVWFGGKRRVASWVWDALGDVTRPMTLRELRNRLVAKPGMFDGEDWGGCGCFVDVEALI